MYSTLTAPQALDDHEIENALRNSGFFAESLFTGRTPNRLNPTQIDPAAFGSIVRAVAGSLTRAWPELNLRVLLDDQGAHHLYLAVPHRGGAHLTAQVDYADLVDRTSRGSAFLIATARRLLTYHARLTDVSSSCGH